MGLPGLPELGRRLGVLQGSYGQKGSQGHSTQLTLSFGPLLLVLSAVVGHTHFLWAGDGSCLARGFTLMGLHLPLL